MTTHRGQPCASTQSASAAKPRMKMSVQLINRLCPKELALCHVRNDPATYTCSKNATPNVSASTRSFRHNGAKPTSASASTGVQGSKPCSGENNTLKKLGEVQVNLPDTTLDGPRCPVITSYATSCGTNTTAATASISAIPATLLRIPLRVTRPSSPDPARFNTHSPKSSSGTTRNRASCSRTSIITPALAPSSAHSQYLRPSERRVRHHSQRNSVTARNDVACDQGGAITV